MYFAQARACYPLAYHLFIIVYLFTINLSAMWSRLTRVRFLVNLILRELCFPCKILRYLHRFSKIPFNTQWRTISLLLYCFSPMKFFDFYLCISKFYVIVKNILSFNIFDKYCIFFFWVYFFNFYGVVSFNALTMCVRIYSDKKYIARKSYHYIAQRSFSPDDMEFINGMKWHGSVECSNT